jgi:hypothetical protein
MESMSAMGPVVGYVAGLAAQLSVLLAPAPVALTMARLPKELY